MPVFVLLMLIVGFMVLVVLTSDRTRGDETGRRAGTGDTGVQHEDDVVV
jgi:hypothetical protein